MSSADLIKLDRGFYLRDAETVARELVGKYLVHQADGERLVARITETEAYLGESDRGAHSYGGRRTARTRIQYGPGGFAYLYFIYGMYDMFNVVAGAAELPHAVLVREAVPVEGLDTIARNRFGQPYTALTPARRRALLDGPGKLCRGLGITRVHYGVDLTGDQLYLCRREGEEAPGLRAGKRINIDYAGEDADLPLRFTMEGGGRL